MVFNRKDQARILASLVTLRYLKMSTRWESLLIKIATPRVIKVCYI